jgi:hypothetical protein
MNALQAFICVFGFCQDENTSNQTIVIRGESAYVQGFPEFKVVGNIAQYDQSGTVLNVKCTLQEDFSSKCENGLVIKLKGT